MEWEVVIGLETHVQLKTKTKIFSGASTEYGAEPNIQACEVSIALPGVLPVLNKEAVKCAVKFGLAINAEIATRSVFNRKNYFYPDLPKGYQISQFELPVVGKGWLSIEDRDDPILITRAHLEEDAGKSVHGAFGSMSGIDLNRAGTPLLEIVTEPVIYSAAEAVSYAKTLHRLVTEDISICDGNMQEGSFRCDVNVSVRPKGSDKLGTRREIKNLNSFKFMQQAIEYETRWQIETLEDGGKIQQATVLFNPDTGQTRAMRSKEEANDYRYFPDPDLLPLIITDEFKSSVKAEMLEKLDLIKERYITEYWLDRNLANYLTSSRALIGFYEKSISFLFDISDTNKIIKTVLSDEDKKLPDDIKENLAIANARFFMGNLIRGDLQAILNKEAITIGASPVTPKMLAELACEILHGEISKGKSKEIIEGMWAGDGDANSIIEKKGLKQESDSSAIEAIIDAVLAANPAMVEEFKAGKEKAFNALVGQAMKASKGKANPAQVNEILKQKLA